jgi:DNA-binding helix-hairpin-helix protein with protein kinase domain
MPRFNWKYLLRAARNLAIQVSQVHEAGHIIGDLNDSNVAVLGTAQVTLVDTDSFQISDGRTTFRCLVGKPEFTAPEIQGQKFADVSRTTQSESGR